MINLSCSLVKFNTQDYCIKETMKLQSQKELKRSKGNQGGVELNLFPVNAPGGSGGGRNEIAEGILMKGQQIMGSLNEEVIKMIQMYSQSGSKKGLTPQQFKRLARDLYSTVDKERQLTEEELTNLVNILDTDKDELISRQEIIDIINKDDNM